MHEYGMMASLLDRAVEEARGRGARSITQLRIELGELSGVSREALETAFAALSPGTLADRASLAFHRVPGRIHCDVCGFTGPVGAGPEEAGGGGMRGGVGGFRGPVGAGPEEADEDDLPPICPRCAIPVEILEGGHVALGEVVILLGPSRGPARADDGPRADRTCHDPSRVDLAGEPKAAGGTLETRCAP